MRTIFKLVEFRDNYSRKEFILINNDRINYLVTILHEQITFMFAYFYQFGFKSEPVEPDWLQKVFLGID
jgi:hypothetical protein